MRRYGRRASSVQSGKTTKMFFAGVQTYVHGQQTFARALDFAARAIKIKRYYLQAHNGVGCRTAAEWRAALLLAFLL